MNKRLHLSSPRTSRSDEGVFLFSRAIFSKQIAFRPWWNQEFYVHFGMRLDLPKLHIDE